MSNADLMAYEKRQDGFSRVAMYNPAFVKRARKNNEKRKMEREKKERAERIAREKEAQRQAKREYWESEFAWIVPFDSHVKDYAEHLRLKNLNQRGLNPNQSIPFDVMRDELIALPQAPTMQEIMRKTRSTPLVVWRQAYAHMLKNHSLRSLPEVGRWMGLDHTTILHSCKRVDDAIAAGNVDEYELPCGAKLYVRRA